MHIRLGGRAARTIVMLAIGAVATAGGALARPAAPTPVQQALTKTIQAGSFRYKLSLLLGSSAVGGGKQYTIGGQGAADLRHRRGTMTLDLGSIVQTLGIKIGAKPLPSKIDIVSVRDVLYIHIPALSTQYPGKEWLKVDPATLPKSQTGGADLGVILGSLNGQQALMLLGGATSVHRIGRQVVSGVSMTRYRTVIDVTKLTANIPLSQRAAARKALRGAGLNKITMDVWIDDSGYVRLITTATVHLKLGTSTNSSAATTLRLGMGFGNYGSKVVVGVPPTRKTVDVGKLLGELSSG
jgi:hypothetical protein